MKEPQGRGEEVAMRPVVSAGGWGKEASIIIIMQLFTPKRHIITPLR